MAAAISAQQSMPLARVLLLEAGSYPRHKVCGEFLSFEATSLLQDLLGATFIPPITINRIALHAGRAATNFRLRHPAFSISRYELDAMLWQRAQETGAECREHQRVLGIFAEEHGHVVETRDGFFHARSVIDASGRWSELSRQTLPASKLIGIKCHFEAATQRDQPTCSLYFFRGGYLGIQPISGTSLNASALVDARLYRDLPSVLHAAGLSEAASRWRECFAPITCAPLRLGLADPVRNGVLCCGDAAGFIDPFAGDGMSLALHSGQLAARFAVEMAKPPRSDLLAAYASAYRARFARAFRSAAWLRRFVFAPAWMQSAGVSAMRIPGFAMFAHARTRAAI